MKKIAIESGLTPVKNFLQHVGYEVQEIGQLQHSKALVKQGFDAIVISGLTQNTNGVQTTLTTAPIIDANGLTPEEVKVAIERV